jgi:hypothetical protein
MLLVLCETNLGHVVLQKRFTCLDSVASVCAVGFCIKTFKLSGWLLHVMKVQNKKASRHSLIAERFRP